MFRFLLFSVLNLQLIAAPVVFAGTDDCAHRLSELHPSVYEALQHAYEVDDPQFMFFENADGRQVVVVAHPDPARIYSRVQREYRKKRPGVLRSWISRSSSAEPVEEAPPMATLGVSSFQAWITGLINAVQIVGLTLFGGNIFIIALENLAMEEPPFSFIHVFPGDELPREIFSRCHVRGLGPRRSVHFFR